MIPCPIHIATYIYVDASTDIKIIALCVRECVYTLHVLCY